MHCRARPFSKASRERDSSIRRYLIYAGASALVAEHWPADSSKDETTRVSLRMDELAQQVRAALLEANRNEGMATELKARLQAIDAALPPGVERHGQPVTRTEIYLDAAELMARGVWAGVWPAEGSGFGWPEGVALRRHFAQRFGSSLDAFVERAKELAIQEKAWMSFAKTMAEIGRPDEARWAIRQLDVPSRSPGAWQEGCYSRVVAVMLEIGDFREADRIVGSAPCYQQRAEIAERYARSGEPARAKEIAYELLPRLPSYMQALMQIIDGPSLADTVRPLITALVLAGERERASREMQEIERFARNEGRYLVSFSGTSLGMAQLAQIYYEIGTEAKADVLIETAITEHGSERHPSWSKPFAIAHAKCASGKSKCLETLLSFSGETVDRRTGEQILTWAIKAGRRDITAEILGQKFNIADAWLLNYSKLSLEVFADDEDAAAQTLGMLIESERRSSDRKLLRCIHLLRLAVAMERRDLAVGVAAVILSRAFSETSVKESMDEDWEAQPAHRTMMLAGTASVLAQLQ